MNGNSGAPKELRIGGQAVIEGVVMRGPKKWALAVRRPSGEIFESVNPAGTLAERYTRANRYFPMRGIFALVDSLIIGIKALSMSGSISLEAAGDEEGVGEETPEVLKTDETEEEGQKGLETFVIVIALIFSLALFLGLFIVVPTVIGRTLDDYIRNTVLYNLVEGTIRITLFILYLAAVSMIPDIKRVFEYHGAEHKTVHAYEAGLPLNTETASKFSPIHMRCGTTFIVIVFVISILVFSLLGRPALWLRIVERLAIVPIVAAFSYEIIRFAGKRESSRVVRIVMTPGLWLQKITTREPDEEQLEVAIRALSLAMGDEPQAAADS